MCCVDSSRRSTGRCHWFIRLIVFFQIFFSFSSLHRSIQLHHGKTCSFLEWRSRFNRSSRRTTQRSKKMYRQNPEDDPSVARCLFTPLFSFLVLLWVGHLEEFNQTWRRYLCYFSLATLLPDLAGHHFKQPYGKEYGTDQRGYRAKNDPFDLFRCDGRANLQRSAKISEPFQRNSAARRWWTRESFVGSEDRSRTTYRRIYR